MITNQSKTDFVFYVTNVVKASKHSGGLQKEKSTKTGNSFADPEKFIEEILEKASSLVVSEVSLLPLPPGTALLSKLWDADMSCHLMRSDQRCKHREEWTTAWWCGIQPFKEKTHLGVSKSCCKSVSNVFIFYLLICKQCTFE